jgi:hypothetical protein
MARPGRKPGQKTKPTPSTARTLALALSLRSKGLTLTEVVDRLAGKASKTTVHRWVKEAEEAGRAAPAGVSAEAERLAEEPGPAFDVDGVDVAELDAHIAEVGEMMKASKKDVMDYVRLARLRADLIVARAKSRPVKPPDPNADPANIEARDLVRARLMHEIEILEVKNPKASPAAKDAAA